MSSDLFWKYEEGLINKGRKNVGSYVAFGHFHRIICSNYISLVTELRQIAVVKALVLLKR